MSKIQIGVIGSGAVGSIIATKLTYIGYDVEYVYDKQSDIVIDGKQEMSVVGGSCSCSALVTCVAKEEDFSTKKDIIFLACKSTHMQAHAKKIKNALTDNGFVVMLNNTLCRHCVTPYIPINKIVGMFIEWSCVKIDYDDSEITNAGPTIFGTYNQDAKPLAELTCKIMEPISHSTYVDNLNDIVLGRIILNSAIASVGAISGLNLGEFLKLKYGRKLFVELIKEGVSVYRHVDIKAEDYDKKLNYDLFCSDTFKGKIYRRQIINFLIKYNGQTRSSILQDLQNNKSIEAEYLIGKIVETGNKHNINCKFSEKVYKKIIEIQENNDTIRPELLKIIYTRK